MTRLTLALARRSRVQLPVWILAISLLWLVSSRAIATEFGDQQQRRELFGSVILNPAIVALRGRPDGLDVDALVYFQVFTFIAVLAGLMSTFLATRGVRGDEEVGRLEAVLATRMRRTTPLVATLLVGSVAAVLVGVGSALALIAAGFDAVGASWAGSATAGTALAFLGLGLLAGQLMPTSRSANGVGVALVLGAYLLRAIGDATGRADVAASSIESAWPSWLSPIGWAQQVSPFGEQQAGPLALLLGAFLVASVAALAVQSRRDLGDSLVRERPGPARADRLLVSPLGLAGRLQRGALLAWVVGGALFGLLTGALSGLASQVAEGADGVQRILDDLAPGARSSLTDTFVVAIMAIAGLLAAAAACQSALRLRAEEVEGRAEPILAAPVGRARWLLSSVAVAAVSGVAVAAAAGLTAAATFSLTDPDADRAGSSILAGVAQLPGVAFFVGVAALAITLLPRAAVAATWGALALAYLLGPIGGILGIDDSIRAWSPFEQVPAVPGADPDWSGAVVVLTIGIVAVGVAAVAMRRRELQE